MIDRQFVPPRPLRTKRIKAKFDLGEDEYSRAYSDEQLRTALFDSNFAAAEARAREILQESGVEA